MPFEHGIKVIKILVDENTSRITACFLMTVSAVLYMLDYIFIRHWTWSSMPDSKRFKNISGLSISAKALSEISRSIAVNFHRCVYFSSSMLIFTMTAHRVIYLLLLEIPILTLVRALTSSNNSTAMPHGKERTMIVLILAFQMVLLFAINYAVVLLPKR
jgi:hypothetical protein